MSILHDVWLPLRYLLGHCIVYPSRRLFTPSVSSWPLYCLSFTTSIYPFGIFLAIALSILYPFGIFLAIIVYILHDVWLPLRVSSGSLLSILHDVWLPLRYLLGHYIVYPSRRLVTPSVSSWSIPRRLVTPSLSILHDVVTPSVWPLYCLSFTTSGYPFDFLGHYSVYPSSFTTSGYPFGIFLAIILSILHDVMTSGYPFGIFLAICLSFMTSGVYPSRRLVTPSVSSWPLYCLSFTTSGYPFGIFLAIILSILHDVYLPLRYLLGHCIVYPSRRLVTPSVSSWPLYCLSFTTSGYPFGIFLAIIVSILHDVWLPLRYLLGHYSVYPSRRLVTPSVSSWPLYCLSFTTSGYPFGIILAIVLSILHDVSLPLRYLLGHYIVYPSRRLVTPSVSSWPLYCLSFTTSRYPFGIFLAIILSILHDVWLPLRYLLGHYSVYPSRRLVTPSVSSWPLYCLSFTTSGYPFGIFLAIILSILHDVWLPLRYLLGHYIVYPSRRLVTPSVSSWPLYCLSFTTSGYPFGIFLAIALSILHDVSVTL